MPRGPRYSEEGSDVNKDDTYDDGDKMMPGCDAAYEEFEAKWMDCLGYSTSNSTIDSEELEDDGEGDYCSPTDKGGEEDFDSYISGTKDEKRRFTGHD